MSKDELFELAKKESMNYGSWCMRWRDFFDMYHWGDNSDPLYKCSTEEEVRELVKDDYESYLTYDEAEMSCRMGIEKFIEHIKKPSDDEDYDYHESYSYTGWHGVDETVDELFDKYGFDIEQEDVIHYLRENDYELKDFWSEFDVNDRYCYW